MKIKTAHMILLCSSLVFMNLIQTGSAKLPDPPPMRSQQEIKAVLDQVPTPPAVLADRLNIVLVADKKDHGPCEHDYALWQRRWQALLSGAGSSPTNLYGPPQTAMPAEDIGFVTVKTAQAWPDEAQLDWADVVVVFCYIQWDEHKLGQLRAYLNRGGGFVPVHSATWTKPGPSLSVAELTSCGGFTQFRHGSLALEIVDPNHPICWGLPPQIEFVDESYWPPTPQIDSTAMHVLAISNERIKKDSAETGAQPMFWTYEYGRGRVFGCVLGHYTWTFDDPYFRLLLLRGMVWSAGQWPFRLDSLATQGIVLKD